MTFEEWWGDEAGLTTGPITDMCKHFAERAWHQAQDVIFAEIAGMPLEEYQASKPPPG